MTISRQELNAMLANGTAIYIGCDGEVNAYHIVLGEWDVRYCEVPCEL